MMRSVDDTSTHLLLCMQATGGHWAAEICVLCVPETIVLSRPCRSHGGVPLLS